MWTVKLEGSIVMEGSKKKSSFFRDVLASIKDFDFYQEFALRNLGKSIGYLLKLMILFSIIVGIAYTYQTAKGIENVVSYLKTDMPDFRYENHKIAVDTDTPIIINNDKSGVIIDAKTHFKDTIEEYIRKISLYDNGVIFLEDRMVIKNAALSSVNTIIYEQLASKYQVENFTKQDVIDYMDGINKNFFYGGLFLGIFLYLVLIYTLSVLIDCIMLAALGYFIARIVGVNIKYRSSFGMAVHAITLPILLNIVYMVVNVFTGFEIRYFNIMYTTISFIYMVTAILIIRTNLLKQQIEIAKVRKEQEKIHEELERQREEEKKEEEPKDETEQQKKEDNGNVGDEAKGEV